MSGDPSASSFWDFSLAFYALPDVAPAFLELQDRCGADVNIMLYLLHVARAQRLLDDEDLARIEACVRPWREAVVAPLRAVRRSLKEPVGAFAAGRSAPLRAEVKRVELAAEKLQQQTLETLFPPERTGAAGSDPSSCARANLRAYAGSIGPFVAEAQSIILARFDRFEQRTEAQK